MPIQFSCPHCGNVTEVSDQYAGQSGPCAKCEQTINIPGSSAAAPDAASGVATPAKKGSALKYGLIGAGSFLAFGCLCMGGLVAMLMPAIHAAREVARRSSCELNQRRIGVIGMMGHHDAFDKLPDNTFGEDGAELHSWRTKILPFMDSYASSLHGRYDHEKPWNAPENSFARDASLDMYHCRSKPAEASLNRSDYLTIYADPATRPQPVFTKGAAVRFRDIVDGMSNTIMAVESSTGVEWVSVNDFAFETMPMSVREGAGAKGISSYHMGGANVLMADGSQQFLPVSIDKDVLKALVTRNGGERPFMGF